MKFMKMVMMIRSYRLVMMIRSYVHMQERSFNQWPWRLDFVPLAHNATKPQVEANVQMLSGQDASLQEGYLLVRAYAEGLG